MLGLAFNISRISGVFESEEIEGQMIKYPKDSLSDKGKEKT